MEKTKFDFAAFVGISENTLPLNNNVFQAISAIKINLRKKVITYDQLHINQDFFDDFLEAITKGTKKIVAELKKIAKRTKSPQQNDIGVIDYNLLDFLEGVIKASVDCKVLTWKILLIDEVSFNELILKIKEILGKESILSILDESRFQELCGRSNPCSKLNDFDINGEVDEETGDDLNEEDELSEIKKRSTCCFEIIRINVPEMTAYQRSMATVDEATSIENEIANHECSCKKNNVNSVKYYPSEVFKK